MESRNWPKPFAKKRMPLDGFKNQEEMHQYLLKTNSVDPLQFARRRSRKDIFMVIGKTDVWCPSKIRWSFGRPLDVLSMIYSLAGMCLRFSTSTFIKSGYTNSCGIGYLRSKTKIVTRKCKKNLQKFTSLYTNDAM